MSRARHAFFLNCTLGRSIEISRARNVIEDEVQKGTDPVQHAGELSGDWSPTPQRLPGEAECTDGARLLQGQRRGARSTTGSRVLMGGPWHENCHTGLLKVEWVREVMSLVSRKFWSLEQRLGKQGMRGHPTEAALC